ncbi:MAG: 1-phosphofructokinase [Methanomicrobiales archaeon]|nr:1-phosphofructokinase [Methanomicrobiales archaeon]
MLYTITPNPALDRTIWLDRLQDEITNRIEREERFPGGKGIGVSRVLKELGVYNHVLGFAGGFHGAELEARLLEGGIQCDFTPIEEETRSNIVIHERSTGRQLLLSSKGPRVYPQEIDRFCSDLASIKDPTLVSIGGSLPAGLKPEVYHTLVDQLKCRGAKVILDAEGEALAEGLSAGPYAIKPNLRELSLALGRKFSDLSGIIDAAEELREKGAEVVLVSMGAKGILLVSRTTRLLASPPPVKVKNTIGAGDSAVAGFIYGITQAYDLETCLRYAVAAGTATTLREGTALAEREDVMRLFPQIHSRTL